MEFKNRTLFHHCYHQTMKQKPRISITIDQGYVPFGGNHNPVFSSLKTYHRVCNKNKRMGASCGAGTAYLSGTPDFTPGV